MRTRDCKHISAMSSPSKGEAGRTGDWRTLTPVIDHTRCTPAKKKKPSCFICWFYCPEVAISRTIPLEIDLDYCKGCGICAAECPVEAIAMVEEKNHPNSKEAGLR